MLLITGDDIEAENLTFGNGIHIQHTGSTGASATVIMSINNVYY